MLSSVFRQNGNLRNGEIQLQSSYAAVMGMPAPIIDKHISKELPVT
jgi:hypothetical protein